MADAAPIGAQMAVLDAVMKVLKADKGLKPLVTGIYDEVTTDRRKATPPYVYAGPMNSQRVPDSYARAWTVRLRFYTASTGFGRRQAWGIAAALDAALDRREIKVAAPYEAQGEMLVTQAGDVIEDPVKTAFVDIEIIVQEDSDDG